MQHDKPFFSSSTVHLGIGLTSVVGGGALLASIRKEEPLWQQGVKLIGGLGLMTGGGLFMTSKYDRPSWASTVGGPRNSKYSNTDLAVDILDAELMFGGFGLF